MALLGSCKVDGIVVAVAGSWCGSSTLVAWSVVLPYLCKLRSAAVIFLVICREAISKNVYSSDG